MYHIFTAFFRRIVLFINYARTARWKIVFIVIAGRFTFAFVFKDPLDDLILAKVEEGVSVERINLPINNHHEFVAQNVSLCHECHLKER